MSDDMSDEYFLINNKLNRLETNVGINVQQISYLHKNVNKLITDGITVSREEPEEEEEVEQVQIELATGTAAGAGTNGLTEVNFTPALATHLSNIPAGGGGTGTNSLATGTAAGGGANGLTQVNFTPTLMNKLIGIDDNANYKTIGDGGLTQKNFTTVLYNKLNGISFGANFGLTEIKNDTTPQLGGNLDVNGKGLISTNNGNISIAPDGTGSVILGAGGVNVSSGREITNVHNIQSTHYSHNNATMVSASRQANFTDLELKPHLGGSHTLLAYGNTGDVEMNGTLSVDIIQEKTSGNGVDIGLSGGVNVSSGREITNVHNIQSTHYSHNNATMVSATRQANFTDLELKPHSGGSHTLLASGDTGDLEMDGILSVDEINPKSGGNIKLSPSGTGDIVLDGPVELKGHIIPDTNAALDLGNAEYKIRHLFLSDNSLWIGDKHKLSVESGELKFKKRNINTIPKSIQSYQNNVSTIISWMNTNNTSPNYINNLSDIPLEMWLAYGKTLHSSLSNIHGIYGTDPDDYDEDVGLSNIASITPSGGGGTINLKIDNNEIISTNTNGDITLTPDGNGNIFLDGKKWPRDTDSALNGYYLKTNATGELSWEHPFQIMTTASDVSVPVNSASPGLSKYNFEWTTAPTSGQILEYNNGNLLWIDKPTSSGGTTITGAASTIVSSDLTSSRALISDSNGKVAVSSITDTELGHLSGVNGNIQDQINLKANIAGPTFTGTPSAPTATAGDSSTQLATTAFVTTAVDNLVGGAPGALDTLNELAAAINDDENYAASITTALSNKQDNLTFGIANTNAVKIDDVNVLVSEYAKFTANGIEGRSFSEVKTDLSLNNVENTALGSWTGSNNITTVGELESLYVDNIKLDGNIISSHTTDTNLILSANGSGFVEIQGNTAGSGQIQLNCENNSHGVKIKGPPHSAGANYTLTLPNDDGTDGQVLKTDGSGNLSWTAQSSGGGGGTTYNLATGTAAGAGTNGLTQVDFTPTLASKLDGIEAGATAGGGGGGGTTYNLATGTASGSGTEGLTEVNFTPTLASKLNGIEAGATIGNGPTGAQGPQGPPGSLTNGFSETNIELSAGNTNLDPDVSLTLEARYGPQYNTKTVIDTTQSYTPFGTHLEAQQTTGHIGLWGCAISGDGSTIAIGQIYADNDGLTDNGKVYVYTWDSASQLWNQIWTKTGDNSDDAMGKNIRLSTDGKVISIADLYHSANDGRVRVFDWNDDTSEYVVRADPNEVLYGITSSEQVGNYSSVDITPDGNIIVIGHYYWDNPPNYDIGMVRVHQWDGTAWTQLGTNSDMQGENGSDHTGIGVSISSDGKTVAVGESSVDQPTSVDYDRGRVKTYDYNGTNWVLRQAIQPTDLTNYDSFGESVSLSGDGNTLAVGAKGFDSTGGSANDGLVRIYDWIGTGWSQRGTDILGPVGDAEYFGKDVKLNLDGSVVCIGAYYADPNNLNDAGAVEVWSWDGAVWAKVSRLESDTAGHKLGLQVDISDIGDFIIACGEGGGGSVPGGRATVYSIPTKTVNVGNITENPNKGLTLKAGGTVTDPKLSINLMSGNPIYETTTPQITVLDTNVAFTADARDIIYGEFQQDEIAGQPNGSRGKMLDLSGDGKIMCAGSTKHDSNRGHVRVFEWDGTQWGKLGNDIDGENTGDKCARCAISEDGKTVVVGAQTVNQVRVFKYNDTANAWDPLGSKIEYTSGNFGSCVDISTDGTAIVGGGEYYTNPSGGSAQGCLRVYDLTNGDWVQRGSDTDMIGDGNNFWLGCDCAMSANGNIVAGAFYDAGSNSGGPVAGAGGVKVYDHTSGSWLQLGSNIYVDHADCMTVSLSHDGTVVAFGSAYDGNAPGTSAHHAGAVYTAKYTNGQWNRTAKISGTQASIYMDKCHLNAAGDVLAIGSFNDELSGTTNKGVTRLYYWSELNQAWDDIGTPIEGLAVSDYSGGGVALNYIGDVLAIGAHGADSADGTTTNQGHIRTFIGQTKQIDGTPETTQTGATSTEMSLKAGGTSANPALSISMTPGGTVYQEQTTTTTVTTYTDSDEVSFNQRADNSTLAGFSADDRAGEDVAISKNGQVVSIGATRSDNPYSRAGHFIVLDWNSGSSTWTARPDVTGLSASDGMGWSVALSDDGSVAAGSGTQINSAAGAVFIRDWNSASSTWTSRPDITGEDSGDNCGYSLGMNSTGSIIIAGSPFNDNAATNCGHARVYEWVSGAWTQLGTTAQLTGSAGEEAGYSVAINSDGTIIAIGAHKNGTNATNSGQARAYKYDSASNTWNQMLPSLNGLSNANDYFGGAVSLSDDGLTLAVSTMAGGGSLPNKTACGYVRVFTWDEDNTTWNDKGDRLEGDTEYVYFGQSISLSNDGNVLVVGESGDGAAPEVPGGRVKVFMWYDTEWKLLGSEINDSLTASDFFGYSVSAVGDIPSGITFITGALLGTSGNNGYARVYECPALSETNDVTTTTQIPTTVSSEMSLKAGGTSANPDLSISMIPGGTVYQDQTTSVTTIDTDSDYTSYGNIIGAAGAKITYGGNIGARMLEFSGDGNFVIFGSEIINTYTGEVRVYKYSNGTWGQWGQTLTGEAHYDYFGCAVAINNDGTIIAVGAYNADTTPSGKGYSKVYKWNGAATPTPAWELMGSKLQNTLSDRCGYCVALSDDGQVFAQGAYSATPSPGSTQAGAIHSYVWDSTVGGGSGGWVDRPTIWGQTQYDWTCVVSLNSDGSIMMVGAWYATNQSQEGEVRIFEWDSGASQYVLRGTTLPSRGGTANNPPTGPRKWGQTTAISSNGNIAASSSGQGTNYDDYVRIFEWNSVTGNWDLIGDLSGDNPGDEFGKSISLSSDGNVLGIGAWNNNSETGFARLYLRDDSDTNGWKQIGSDIAGSSTGDRTGYSVSLSGDGHLFAVGSPYANSDAGRVDVYSAVMVTNDVTTQVPTTVSSEMSLKSNNVIKMMCNKVDFQQSLSVNGSYGNPGDVLTSGGIGQAMSWTTPSSGGGGGGGGYIVPDSEPAVSYSPMGAGGPTFSHDPPSLRLIGNLRLEKDSNVAASGSLLVEDSLHYLTSLDPNITLPAGEIGFNTLYGFGGFNHPIGAVAGWGSTNVILGDTNKIASNENTEISSIREVTIQSGAGSMGTNGKSSLVMNEDGKSDLRAERQITMQVGDLLGGDPLPPSGAFLYSIYVGGFKQDTGEQQVGRYYLTTGDSINMKSPYIGIGSVDPWTVAADPQSPPSAVTVTEEVNIESSQRINVQVGKYDGTTVPTNAAFTMSTIVGGYHGTTGIQQPGEYLLYTGSNIRFYSPTIQVGERTGWGSGQVNKTDTVSIFADTKIDLLCNQVDVEQDINIGRSIGINGDYGTGGHVLTSGGYGNPMTWTNCLTAWNPGSNVGFRSDAQIDMTGDTMYLGANGGEWVPQSFGGGTSWYWSTGTGGFDQNGISGGANYTNLLENRAQNVFITSAPSPGAPSGGGSFLPSTRIHLAAISPGNPNDSPEIILESDNGQTNVNTSNGGISQGQSPWQGVFPKIMLCAGKWPQLHTGNPNYQQQNAGYLHMSAGNSAALLSKRIYIGKQKANISGSPLGLTHDGYGPEFNPEIFGQTYQDAFDPTHGQIGTEILSISATNIEIVSTNVVQFYGQVSAQVFQTTSDDRLKHNEEDITDSLGIIRKLKPQKYQKTKEMKEADFNGTLTDGEYTVEAGFIAQDILKVPELAYCVSGGDFTKTLKDSEGVEKEVIVEKPYSVNYTDILTYNVSATKELDTIVTNLLTKIATLESRITELENK